MSEQPFEPMIEGTLHLAYDDQAGAIHYDVRPPNATWVRIDVTVLLDLIEQKRKALGRSTVLVRHDLLGSHVETPEPPKAIPRRVTSARVQTPPGTIIEGKIL